MDLIDTVHFIKCYLITLWCSHNPKTHFPQNVNLSVVLWLVIKMPTSPKIIGNADPLLEIRMFSRFFLQV